MHRTCEKIVEATEPANHATNERNDGTNEGKGEKNGRCPRVNGKKNGMDAGEREGNGGTKKKK